MPENRLSYFDSKGRTPAEAYYTIKKFIDLERLNGIGPADELEGFWSWSWWGFGPVDAML